MNRSFKSMLATFELTFGKDFWHHVSIVVSSHSGYGDDPDEQLCIEEWKKQITKMCPDSANASLETVVLDAKKKDLVWFEANAEKLWRLISATVRFECKDLTAVKTEVDQVKALNKDLLEELARLRNLSGIQVSFSC